MTTRGQQVYSLHIENKALRARVAELQGPRMKLMLGLAFTLGFLLCALLFAVLFGDKDLTTPYRTGYIGLI